MSRTSIALCRDASMRNIKDQLGLGTGARALVIVSEGVTDPQLRSQVLNA